MRRWSTMWNWRGSRCILDRGWDIVGIIAMASKINARPMGDAAMLHILAPFPACSVPRWHQVSGRRHYRRDRPVSNRNVCPLERMYASRPQQSTLVSLSESSSLPLPMVLLPWDVQCRAKPGCLKGALRRERPDCAFWSFGTEMWKLAALTSSGVRNNDRNTYSPRNGSSSAQQPPFPHTLPRAIDKASRACRPRQVGATMVLFQKSTHHASATRHRNALR